MDSSEISSGAWLVMLGEAWAETGGRPQDIGAAVSERLGADPVASALVAGVCELAAYAAVASVDTDTAVDAEAEALSVSRRVVRPLLEAKLQVRMNELDAARQGQNACGSCGESALSQGRRRRSWESLMGSLSLQRRYVHCARCKTGYAPAQVHLGLPASDFTPRLEEVCTMMATTVPFGMAHGLVAKLCGIEHSTKALQEMTERRGAEVLRLNEEQAQEFAPYDAKGLPVEVQRRPDDAAKGAPRIAYMEIDGVIPITREELVGKELTDKDRDRQARAKADKAHGGRGKRFRIVGREVKNAVLYDGSDCAKESVGRGCILSKTYVSYLGEWGPFAERLWVAMLERRFDKAELLVVLSDGAEWIRSVAKWLPVPTLLILDLYHVKHRLWEVANSLYGQHSKRARRWANHQCDRIEDGDAKKVIASLRRMEPRRSESRELVRVLVGYLENNFDRMDYPAYRAQGLRVGSGAVESANFHVTGTRLKLQGMRWSAEGAAQMAVLREDLFNGRHETRTRQIIAA
jgi:hypothetical protein